MVFQLHPLLGVFGDAKGGRGYINGLRGIMERNAVRYFLAVRVHLATLNLPPEHRFERGIQDWFDATERYPRQLHEMDKESYLAAKRQGRIILKRRLKP